MIKHKLISDNKGCFRKIDRSNYVNILEKEDKEILNHIISEYRYMSSDSLMKLTYINYQYYAINSIKAKEILTNEQYINIIKAKPQNDATTLYTIGYEGISLEAYLNRLIKNDIKVLVDVRNNPLSMKYGFSKSQLKTYCESLNIEYIHIPEVGIQSSQRQNLYRQSDYDALFKVYNEVNLKKTQIYQEQILNLLIAKKRIALTCFEANICQCHRTHLAKAIINLPEWKYDLKHI